MKTLVAFIVTIVSFFTLGQQPVIMEKSPFASSIIKMDKGLGFNQLYWYGFTNDEVNWSIMGLCPSNNNNSWQYKFPNHPRVAINGIALVAFDDGDELDQHDLDSPHVSIHAMFDTNYEIRDTIDIVQLVKLSEFYSEFPPQRRFAWVGYVYSQKGTVVVSSSPSMNAEETFSRLKEFSNSPDNEIYLCDNKDQDPRYEEVR